jgi:predicted outer membrane protein
LSRLPSTILAVALAFSATALAADPAPPDRAAPTAKRDVTGPTAASKAAKPVDDPTTRIGSEPMADAQIVTVLETANERQAQLARVVVARSSNPDVTKLAQMLAQEHTDALGKVRAWMKAAGTQPTPSGTDRQLDRTADENKKTFEAASSPELDRWYLDAMVTQHADLLDLLDQLAGQATNQDLKAMIREMHPKVEAHLAEIRRIRDDIVRNPPVSTDRKGGSGGRSRNIVPDR